MNQRRHALRIRQLQLGAVHHQTAHDLSVGSATVTQDDGLEQRRPAEAVDMVDVDLCLQQLAHRLHVAVVRRWLSAVPP